MSDDEFKNELLEVTDPKKALRLIIENERLFGYDAYYSDLRQALLEMAERLSQ